MTVVSEVSKVDDDDEYTKSVIKTMHLTSEICIDNEARAMEIYQKVEKEFSVEEIVALGRLYNKENPITFAGIISSNYRIVHLVFLEKMGKFREDLELLSDLELKDLIVENILDEYFRQRAKKLFFIER